ncbi:hypothetical protein BGZ90_005094 [Linnemannia elongata]|nr:hypothetical protein BGZ90_005094 [Linnemannia elongata]
MDINPPFAPTNDNTTKTRWPKILIAGAGVGGLTLGAILQKSDIPYEIFERAPEIKPLGSGLILTANVAPLFKQLGIYDELVAQGKPNNEFQVFNEQRQLQYTMEFRDQTEQFGAQSHYYSRPAFYDFLFRQVPKERVHLGKKIISTQQDKDGVLIKCSDGTEYKGDIIVGSDGAYSAVRQSLYKELKEANKLPDTDALPLPFSTVRVGGLTRPLDVTEFPDLAKETCQFIQIVGDGKPYSWVTQTTIQGRVSFGVVRYLDEELSKDNNTFLNEEWGPEAAEAMCDEVRDFPVVSGGDRVLTVGDLIDLTPKEYISKVMLEEKVFQTWFGGRTVLLGDACHKFSPAGGAGASNAIHDAIVLANYIHALPNNATAEDIEKSFQAYQDERMPWVLEASGNSKFFKTMTTRTITGALLRAFTRNMPQWLQRKNAIRGTINRPQLYWLPQIEDTGSVKAAPQPNLWQKRLDLIAGRTSDSKRYGCNIRAPTNSEQSAAVREQQQ